jgi:hypothetical protein
MFCNTSHFISYTPWQSMRDTELETLIFRHPVPNFPKLQLFFCTVFAFFFFALAQNITDTKYDTPIFSGSLIKLVAVLARAQAALFLTRVYPPKLGCGLYTEYCVLFFTTEPATPVLYVVKLPVEAVSG